MPNSRDDHNDRFHDLNWLGKSVLLGGAAVRLTAHLVERGVERTTAIIRDSERAFRQGRDPNVEEATILEEQERREKE